MSESDDHAVRLPWHKSAESRVESIPGVIFATIEGSRDWVSEVRVWYEPTCLIKEGARLAATRFRAVVAQPIDGPRAEPVPLPPSRRRPGRRARPIHP